MRLTGRRGEHRRRCNWIRGTPSPHLQQNKTKQNKTKQNKTKQNNKTKMKKNHKNNSIHYLTRNTNKHQQARQKKNLFFL